MMDFIVMTLSFTVAILLATVIVVVAVMNKPVMKWYMKKVNKLTMVVLEDTLAASEEEES